MFTKFLLEEKCFLCNCLDFTSYIKQVEVTKIEGKRIGEDYSYVTPHNQKEVELERVNFFWKKKKGNLVKFEFEFLVNFK